MNQYTALFRATGYPFKNIELLITALTHPSVSAKNNQRLEYLGDAVLEFCISKRLFLLRTDLREGSMTALRQRLVCEEALYQIALSISLGEYLWIEKGLAAQGGRRQKSILSDAMEALLAAIYLDGGIEEAEKVICRLWPDEMLTADIHLEPKNVLQEMLQKNGHPMPEYRLTDEQGPDHDKRFTVEVLIEGVCAASGTGGSKKKAEQNAAEIAIKKLTEGNTFTA